MTPDGFSSRGVEQRAHHLVERLVGVALKRARLLAVHQAPAEACSGATTTAENITFHKISSVFVVMSQCSNRKEGRNEMFYLTMHSTHFIYGYMEGRKERNVLF